MADTVTTQAPTDQRDSKSVAANIANGVQSRSNGKTPEQAPTASVDPNAGKEKYVVDGREVWLTSDQRTAWIQKGMSFEPKMTQLDKLQKEVGMFMQKLEADPIGTLKSMAKQKGIPVESLYEKILDGDDWSDSVKEIIGNRYYGKVVAPLKMTPEERRAAELEKENAKYKTAEEQRESRALQEENRRRVEAAMSQLKANISEAMKESGLPNNDSPLGVMMARRVADIMRLGYKQRQTITPKDAISRVKSEMKQLQAAYYDHLDPDKLVEELGPVNAEKVKKHFLKLVKDAEKTPIVNRSPATPKGERKTTSMDDFHDYLDELKKKG